MDKIYKKRSAYPWILVSVAAVFVDQLLKYWILSVFTYQEVYRALPFLNFTLVYNPGAAFSFLGSAGGWQIYFFSLVSMIISILFLIWLIRTPRSFTSRALGLSLIIGGAIGNFIDRMHLGYVIDYIDFYVGSWHFATFNFADTAICIGAFFLLYSLISTSEK